MVSSHPVVQPLPPRVRWPIVGREHEVGILLEKLTTSSGGVVVVGPPGMGKSTLVTAAVAVYQAQTPLAGGGPRGVRSSVIRLPLPHENSTPLTTFGFMVDETGSFPTTLEGLAGLVAEGLGAAPEGLPPVLYAEDLHLFDEQSAKVLGMVLAGGHARLFGTVRDKPGMPAAIDTLWRNGQLERMELAPLSYESVRLILRSALEEPASNDMAYRLWLTTAGNPLHIRELLYSIVEAGDVRFVGTALTWTAPLRADRRLTDLLARDITTLTGAQRDVVDLVALAESVPLRTISAMAEDSVLRELVDRTLIVIDRLGNAQENVMMGHPLYAETLRSLLYPQRKRQLFGLLPQHELPAQGPAGILRWVDWALECEAMPDVSTLLLAGETAESMTQPLRAVQLATLALDHVSMHDAERVQALLLRARAYRDCGDALLAEADVLAVQEHGRFGSLLPEPVVVATAGIMADLWQYHRGDMDAAMEVLTSAEKSLDPLGEHANALAVDQLSRLGFAGRYEEFLAGVDAALAASDHPANLTLTPTHVYALGQAGRPVQALELAAQALARIGPEHTPFPALRTAVLSARFWAALWAGNPAFAVCFPDVDESTGQRHDAGIYQTGTGYAALSFGQWDQAIAEFRGALSRFTWGAPTGLEPLAWAGLACAYAHYGDLDNAKTAREEFRLVETRMNRSIEMEIRYRVLLVGKSLADADLSTQISDFIQWCRDNGHGLGVLWGLHLCVVVAAESDGRVPLEALEALEEAARSAEGKVSAAMLAHARALLGEDAGVIALAVSALNATGVWIPCVPSRVALTARQREIAALVVSGMANRSIAEKLTISVRTVDTHVAHLFGRLGVTRRADLANALVRATPGVPAKNSVH
ncbi:helix-turn-helix transcriptional regulator [Arthrobacter sp. AQ5-05]|uniref:helix-turn-helix transcriptional regulator n=1 Tax=Arthrobacter sp. AQ5-05 TaxID=2184581 RepID=UPI0012B58304|nr:LuxR family transcriptional regulator [Arthrobacter sp. AQ5-05]